MMGGRRRGGFHGELVAVVTVLFLVPSVTGCSLAFVKGPEAAPADERRLRRPPPLTCTTSDFLPYADAVGAALVLFEPAIIIATSDENAAALASALVGGLLAALLLGSGTVGLTASANAERRRRKSA